MLTDDGGSLSSPHDFTESALAQLDFQLVTAKRNCLEEEVGWLCTLGKIWFCFLFFFLLKQDQSWQKFTREQTTSLVTRETAVRVTEDVAHILSELKIIASKRWRHILLCRVCCCAFPKLFVLCYNSTNQRKDMNGRKNKYQLSIYFIMFSQSDLDAERCVRMWCQRVRIQRKKAF